MNKQTLCWSLLAILFANASFAYQVDYKGEVKTILICPPKILQAGPYMGGGLGYDAYKIRQTNNFFLPPASVSFNPSLSAKGLFGTIFAGYGQYYDWFYIAGEIMAGTTHAQNNFSLSTASDSYLSRVEAGTSYGAGILPGIKLSPTSMIYARLGYVRTLFKSRESGSVGGGFNVFTSNWGNGVNIGLGIESLVYQNWSIRGEYSYTTYSGYLSELNTEFSPANNQFVLSGIYHFSC